MTAANGRRGPLETGVLYCDENLSRLARMPSASVDLIYLDPPFFSNKFYEVIWGDEAEVRSFEDRWEGGMQHYIGWMRPRVMELRRVLKPEGSLYLHCDPHASHYLKVMLDEIFGDSAFRSEVVWKRTTAHNSAKRYGPVHDLIFLYANKNYTWNPQHQAYGEKYLASKYRYKDSASGKLYRLSDMTGAGTRKGDSGKEWRGYNPTSIGRHWQPPSYCYWKYQEMTGVDLASFDLIKRLDELDRIGLVHWPKTKNGKPEHKRYLDDMPGVALQDVWTDIDPINARARERLGYPTQKPEALLERIILASSNPGDVVLDPFCGCGTTVSVAERLDRQWIGIDVSPTAVRLMQRRLLKSTNGACRPKTEGMPATVDELHSLKPFEFQNWVISKVWGIAAPRKSGDMGIDGYSFMVQDPIQVKQSEKVGRNVVDNFETAIRRAGKDRGYIIAFSFTKDAKEEVARARWKDKLSIDLVTVESLLAATDETVGPLIPDDATILQLPLHPPRSMKNLPTVEELIASDQTATSA